ncbi:1-phosphofructokinase family hexose kinase [Paratissierella segnis]|jgi:tagatose 6-phosphate kinase|uniref:Tagatose-6-phosphate kinase n=1 Tax=Paratissierella segnis TaxID=2763679 RepID=A0A926EV07_9FIRM|nr:PfkB family carbohydrate kinase [Paratissierella segnis]MBC8589421.1 hypothetical protein [Paratissierella segnis]
MIFTIDLNPILKRKYILSSTELDDDNLIAKDVTIGPGGEAIELSYLLHGLNEEVFLSGFLGGINGEYIRKTLNDVGISNDYLFVKDETADSIIISLRNREINIKGEMPRITREDIVGFYELFNRNISRADILCCIGDLPKYVSKEIFYNFISLANRYGKKSLLRTHGDELKIALDASPYLVLINQTDLEYLTKLKLDYEYEIIKATQYILDKEVSVIAIDLGRNGSIVLTKEHIYRVDIEKLALSNVNINYGYMLGGYALALSRNYDLEMMLKLGQACGMANSFEDWETFDMGDIKRIMNDIDVNIFNY